MDQEDVPLMMQKSDGGYTYDTTDMAAIDHRLNNLKVDQILYVTDQGQKSHFDKVFKAAEMSKIFNKNKQKVHHIGFGLMLGEDGGKIKTRSGDSIKLHELLDEAQSRALKLLYDRINEPKMAEFIKNIDIDLIAETLSINSIKYFDLKQNRVSSYKFSFDNMLEPKGDTGVYITYMYVRICSILRKGGYTEEMLHSLITENGKITLNNPYEISLALSILRLPETIDDVFLDFQINKLCEGLYDLCTRFAEFYQTQKVLGDSNEKSRVLLIYSARIIMEKYFYLLGMKTID